MPGWLDRIRVGPTTHMLMAQRQLNEAQCSLLMAQAAEEYAKAEVARQMDRCARLRLYVENKGEVK